MRSIIRAGLALAAVAALFALAASSASAFGGRPQPHPVFVQTDNLAGNQVIAYDRAPNGALVKAGTYATGGLGGKLEGAVVDNVASQEALAYDSANDLLYAVNAGSDSVSVFAVDGDRLHLRQVVGSGGSFPVSVAVHRGLVYVLNARDGANVQGYRAAFGRLFPLSGSGRELGLDATKTPEFVNTPGQVGFSPDGSQLIVTTKANGSRIDVFSVRAFGRLSAQPVENEVPGTVPFGFTFDQRGNLLVTQAGPNAVASYDLHRDGTLTELASLATGQGATCWVVRAGKVAFVSNAASGSISRVRLDGGLTLLGNTATDGGTVDAAVSADGRFLYVQAGAAGIVDEFAIGSGGSLTPVGSVTVPGAAGGEGIVAL